MSFYGIHQTSKCHKRCGEQAEGGGVSQRLLKNKKKISFVVLIVFWQLFLSEMMLT